jgi:nucleotide-binding universal stress UspA family protein
MRTFKKILVPIDFSLSARAALETALQLAKTFGGSVDALNTWSTPSYLPAFTALKLENNEITETVHSRAHAQAKEAMAAFLEDVNTSGVTVTTKVAFGPPADVIVAASTGYDLVVMGTHGRTGMSRLVLGSVAAKVVQRSFCPVLTVREDKVDAATAEELHRHPDQRVVYGLLEGRSEVHAAFHALHEAGVPQENISLMMSHETHAALEDPENVEALKGATTGGIFGGTIGGILGGLTSMSALAVGGSIGLMVMGPALALAAAGGLAGGLIGWGVPQDQARRVQAALQEGRSVIAVHLSKGDDLDRIRGTLEMAGAHDVHLGK